MRPYDPISSECNICHKWRKIYCNDEQIPSYKCTDDITLHPEYSKCSACLEEGAEQDEE